MSCRRRYLGFGSASGILLAYLVYGSDRLGRVSRVYFQGVGGSKGFAFVKFYIIKNLLINKILQKYLLIKKLQKYYGEIKKTLRLNHVLVCMLIPLFW